MSNLNPNDQKDTRKIKRIGLVLTVLIHGLVIGALAYTYAWVPPDPPIPKKGMSIDLGSDFYQAKKGKKVQKNDAKKEDVQKLKKEQKQEQKEVRAVEETQIIEQKAVVTQTEESVALQKEEIKEKESDLKPTTQTEKLKATKQKAVAETKTEVIENEGKDVGDGDLKESDYADAGKKTGKSQGVAKDGMEGANGVSLDLSGWIWQREPVVNDPTYDSGSVTIELTIDKYGNVISSQILDKTMSMTAAKHYKTAVEKSKFKPIKRGGFFSKNTKGTVTFTKRVD